MNIHNVNTSVEPAPNQEIVTVNSLEAPHFCPQVLSSDSGDAFLLA